MTQTAMHRRLRAAITEPTPPGTELERDVAWDRFLAAQPDGDVVQSTAWAQAKRAAGFETNLVVCREGDDIVGGGLLVMKRFGPLGAVGYVARGPLIADPLGRTAARIVDEIERVARAHRVRHLVIQPPRGGERLATLLAARGYRADALDLAPNATIVIDLSPGLERVLAAMSSSKRRDVRYSQRRGLEVRMGDRADIAAFHALHEATARRQGFEALPLSYMRHQWDALDAVGGVRLVLACLGGRPLAGVWLTVFGDTVTYRLPGWNGEEPRRQPNVACHWHALAWTAASGYRYYDLGGINRRFAELLAAGQPVPDDFRDSPASFKATFGGSPLLLPLAAQRSFGPLARMLLRPLLSGARNGGLVDRLARRLRSG